MRGFFEALAVFAVLLTVALFTIGAFIHGYHTDVTPAGNNCYTITKSYTHWYPSSDTVVSRHLICEKEK